MTRGVVLRDGSTGNGHNQLCDGHAPRPDQHEGPSTDFVRCPHAKWRGAHVDDVCRDRDEERVANAAVGEEGGTIVAARRQLRSIEHNEKWVKGRRRQEWSFYSATRVGFAYLQDEVDWRQLRSTRKIRKTHYR